MAEQFVKSKIAPNKVVVFGKRTCPFCHKAVDCLEELGLKPGHFEYVDISSRKDMEEIQSYFQKTTGARTVPRIFIGETCIGGFTDLDALKRSGELESMLRKIGAL
ncbi:glutaredoxin-1 [Varanus komodoensis]|uniref:Glutaredoxin-1 n=1 Tax=Varanus komodoensis TaxID=61221 RepID=A0A8D2JDM7_VARKO|nr:glutaredoxin-1 [Varanus komodoensis]